MAGNPEPETDEQDNKRFLRIKDWKDPHLLIYDRLTGEVREVEDTEDVENMEEVG